VRRMREMNVWHIAVENELDKLKRAEVFSFILEASILHVCRWSTNSSKSELQSEIFALFI
jgi:hypothetical protein